uniref:MULE transposase domain-containing protein n=1 Tax=Arundo donax TaxID=35708 RepID=A0A0A9H230_ARUDO
MGTTGCFQLHMGCLTLSQVTTGSGSLEGYTQQLSPPGLVISTDAGKGIDIAVTKVFSNGVEHRECMRHLVKNFQKRYRGDVFQKHLWPACRAYNKFSVLDIKLTFFSFLQS